MIGLSIKKWWKKVTEDESGATAIEYGLFAALIAVVIIVAVTSIGNSLNVVFTDIATRLNDVATSVGGGGGGGS